MPATPTTRLQIPLPSQSDPADVPTDLGKLANKLDPLVAVFGQGAGLSSRPAAGQQGRLWAHQPGANATPALAGKALSYDDGTSWTHIGSSVPILAIDPAVGVVNTTSLPKTGDCDDGQEILISIPSIPKGGFWQQAQNFAMWHLRLYKSINWWVAVGDMALRSEFIAGGPATFAASASPGYSSIAPRIIVPVAGRYDYDAWFYGSASATANVNISVGTYDFTTRANSLPVSSLAMTSGVIYTVGSTRHSFGTTLLSQAWAIDLSATAGPAVTLSMSNAGLALYPRLISPNN